MNKKIIRPLLSVLLALVLAVGALPLSVFADNGSAALLPSEAHEDLAEPIVEDSGEGSDTLLPENTPEEPFSDDTVGNSDEQNDNLSDVPPLYDEYLTGRFITPPTAYSASEVMPLSAVTDIIDPSYTIEGFDVHGSGSDTTYTVKGGTWIYDGGNNALFCTEWDDLAPNDNAKIKFYGLMEDCDGSLDFSAEWAYKCINGAQGIWNDSAYSALTERMKLFAINRAMLQENNGHYYTSYRTPVEGNYSTKEQATQMMKMIDAIYDAAQSSSETLPLVSSSSAEITATLVNSKYYSGSNYVLGEYTLDTEGVIAKVASGSTPGVTATVNGTTLIVSIPSSMMSSGGAVSATVNLSVASKKIYTMLLYEITSQNPGYQLLCTLGEYESSAEGVVNVGGVIENNEPGRVAVYKVDSTNKSKGLQGAVFMLSNPETFETYYLVTDSSGYAISNYLTVGMWTITEVQAPTGYQNSGWSRTVFITPFTTTITYTVENTPISGKVKIIKTATYGGTVSGWRFTIYTNAACTTVATFTDGTKARNLTTDSTGSIASKDLTPGTYYVKETGYPSGESSYYWNELPMTAQAVTVTAGATASVSFQNNWYGHIGIMKTLENPEAGTPSGWIFDIYSDSACTSLVEGHLITDAFGYIYSEKLTPGTYYVKEVGYTGNVIFDYWFCANSNPQAVTVTAGQTAMVTFDNALRPGKITVKKTDDYGRRLAGVTFLLEYSTDGGNTWYPVNYTASQYVRVGTSTSMGLIDGTLTTGADGTVIFEGLYPLHDYRLTEVATVSGCQLLTEPVYIGKLPLERDLELEFSVINHLMPTLPATGSSGMLISILAALILSAAGTALLVVSKRKGGKA